MQKEGRKGGREEGRGEGEKEREKDRKKEKKKSQNKPRVIEANVLTPHIENREIIKFINSRDSSTEKNHKICNFRKPKKKKEHINK